MDKNSITGFVLIAVLIFAFSWYNKPTEEQMQAQRREKDSIYEFQQEEFRKSENANYAEIKAASETIKDSAALANNFGAFASSVYGKEEIISLENEVISLKFSTKGAKMQNALLKKYATYEEKPVILFVEYNGNYSFSFVPANQSVIPMDYL